MMPMTGLLADGLSSNTQTRCIVRLELRKLTDDELHLLEFNTLDAIKYGHIDDQIIIIYEECQIELVMRGFVNPDGMLVSVEWEPLMMAVFG